MVLVCALLFAVHILVIDHFSPLVDGVRMSCIQFWVCGILSIFPAFFSEMHHSVAGIAAWVQPLGTLSAWIPILYAGVLSCGVAYTLQIVGQNGLNPTVASMIMSLESVFSVIAGWIILGERMGVRQLAGCGLIFAAILLAQIPVGRKRKRWLNVLRVDDKNTLFSQEKICSRRTYIVETLEKNTSFYLLEKMG